MTWLVPSQLRSVCSVGLEAWTSAGLSQPGLQLWVTLSGTPTLRPYSWRGWKTRPWSRRLFGAAMLPNSHLNHFTAWMPSAAEADVHIVPTTLEEANAFVEAHHRHHRPVLFHKFSIAVAEIGEVCGVAIIGRPVARHLDDGWTLEVSRCCTDGTRNACSMLYGAAWRAARALGYRKLITYTLPEEGGASLRAAGWRVVGQTTNTRGWNAPSRPRVDTHPLQAKLRWEAGEA